MIGVPVVIRYSHVRPAEYDDGMDNDPVCAVKVPAPYGHGERVGVSVEVGAAAKLVSTHPSVGPLRGHYRQGPGAGR
jgi:hypothetical protein